jgi:hypothetical protein
MSVFTARYGLGLQIVWFDPKKNTFAHVHARKPYLLAEAKLQSFVLKIVSRLQ